MRSRLTVSCLLCAGRYGITTNPEAMRRLFKFTNATPNLRPNHNAAPTQILPVVRLGQDGDRELVTLKWGLIPFWAKDAKIAYSTINARAETVAEKSRSASPSRNGAA